MLSPPMFTSCRQRYSNDGFKKQEALKERINGLGEESVGTISLGRGAAAPSENTEYIISQKDAAVPLLVAVLKDNDALKNEKELIKVAYAAYCLRRINSDEGKEAATKLAAKLQAKSEGRSFEENFALGEMLKYWGQVDSKSGSPNTSF
jgi:hypothetical protein